MKIVLITLLLIIQAVASDVVSGTSVGKYLKPGLGVELTYSSEKVDVNKVSDVNITLTSSAIDNGILDVTLRLDKELEGLKEDTYAFTIDKNNRSFSIKLHLSSAIEGIHYVNLFAEVKDVGMRAYSVPVYIGNSKNKFQNKPIQKTASGENITVFTAEETIVKGH